MLTKPLTLLVNQCLYTGIYPSQLKLSQIKPLNNNLLCLDQFGFRPGHSTELAALRLVDHLITQMDSCRVPTNIYIDLSNAFDTLNDGILLQKLKYYGITRNSINLL